MLLHNCCRKTPRELTGLTPRELGVSERSFQLTDLDDSDISDDDVSVQSSAIASPRPPLPKTPRTPRTPGGGAAPMTPRSSSGVLSPGRSFGRGASGASAACDYMVWLLASPMSATHHLVAAFLHASAAWQEDHIMCTLCAQAVQAV